MYILILEAFPKDKMMVAVRPQDYCQVQGHLGLKRLSVSFLCELTSALVSFATDKEILYTCN